MSIVQYYADEDWLERGRFRDIPDYVDMVVVTFAPSEYEAPDPLVRFLQYERYNDERGTGWEQTDSGEEPRDNFPHLKPQRIKTDTGWTWMVQP